VSTATAGAAARLQHQMMEKKEQLEDDDHEENLIFSDLHNASSIASTSSSASSSCSSSSAASSSSGSGSSTPDLRDADVRNYEECTPSPAHLFFSSRSQQAAFNFQHQHAASSGALLGPSSLAAASSSALPHSHSSSSYRAPLSTFLPLPPSIDDLNFSNLLDRQIREHAKEGMKSMARACVDGTKETIMQQWQEMKQYVPSNWLPYLTGQHARYLVPLTSSLILAQLCFRSPRFRAVLIRMSRFGLDCGILMAALSAAVTAYRELTISSSSASAPSRNISGLSSPRASPQLASSRAMVVVSPAAQLPSLTMFQRMHRLPPHTAVTTLAASWHSFTFFVRWLKLRYQSSGTLRTSTLVLMVWFAWLARNSSVVHSQRAKLVDLFRQLLNKQARGSVV
jgi:hypothetical protein